MSYIVEIETTGFSTQYVGNYWHRGYDHVSDLISTPVQEQAYKFDDRETADQAARIAERGGRTTARVVEV